MAQIPTPRSYSKILGDAVDVFLSRFSVKKLRKGSAILSTLETSAMSDLRNTQDIFALLRSNELSATFGTALERIARDEGTEKLGETVASGVVTIRDSRITKIASKLFQGKAAPIVGSATLYVADASSFPSSGQIYVGRGTTRTEGPLTYTGVVDSGSYWTLTLAGGSETTRFHDVGESIVVAQNGNRTIGTSIVPQTPRGNGIEPIQYSVLYPTVLLDGETEITGVMVIAKKPGITGNATAGSITDFAAVPFTGATVTNPSPFANARANETDFEVQERIRGLRASRSKGTDVAIETAVFGQSAPDEASRITSTSIVSRSGISTLYVDDGSGYEQKDQGVAQEPLADSAIGGETIFQLASRPVSKALVESAEVAPFDLTDFARLAVLIGGVRSEHVFDPEDFAVISAATAFEVVASINGNSVLPWSARTSSGGTKVTLFADTETNEDIQVTTPDQGNDGNVALGFPLHTAYSLRLYKNDVLLSKDGSIASLRGGLFGGWDTLVGSETLELSVDGTPAVTYTFTDADFVSVRTPSASLGNNSLAVWAAVFSARLPGVTTTTDSGALVLTSNRGRSLSAALVISGGTLVTKGVFAAGSAVGTEADYSLNRPRAQIELAVPLVAGDRLSAGSTGTRAFLESTEILPITLATDGLLFLAIDGSASAVPTGITAANLFTITKVVHVAFGARYRLAAQSGAPFADVVVGDWLLIWDSDAAWASIQGRFRIAETTSTYIEFEHTNLSITGTNLSFVDGGVAVVRSSTEVQEITVPAGTNYTADSYVTALENAVQGAEIIASKTTRLRARTNTYDDGDIALVAANTQGLKTGLAVESVANHESHIGAVQSANAEFGTPDFTELTVDSAGDLDGFATTGALASDRGIVGLKNTLITSGEDRYGNNAATKSFVEQFTAGSPATVELRRDGSQVWLPHDRFYAAAPYSVGPEDDLAVLVDGDVESKRFVTPMWRSLRPTTGTYGTTNSFRDIGDGNQTPASLAVAFGLSFSFNDFAAFMKARVKSHPSTANKSALWRYARWGAEGESARLRYVYPDAPSLATAVETTILPSGDEAYVDVDVALASGAARSGYTLRNSSKVGYGYYEGVATLGKITVCLGFSIASATRATGVTTLTLTMPDGTGHGMYAITSHGLHVADKIWVESSSGSFLSGLKTLTGVTGTTVSYTDAGADTTVASIGTLSFDPAGEAKFAGGSIVIGDILRLGVFDSIPAEWQDQSIRISHVEAQALQGFAESEPSSEDLTLAWQTVEDSSRIQVFPLGTTTVSAIVAAVNALRDCSVSATLLGSGAGTVTLSSHDDVAETLVGGFYPLQDGLNFIRTTTPPGSVAGQYSLVFKDGVDGGLVSTSDWANEEIRVAPITAKNVVDMLSVPALSGLFASAAIQRSSAGNKVQIATAVTGSAGSVEVQGGSANSATAAVVGSALTGGSYTVATISAAASKAVRGGHWVRVDNTERQPKTVFLAASKLNTIAADGSFVFDNTTSTPFYTQLNTVPLATVQIEHQGTFTAIIGADLGTAAEGDWVRISRNATPAANDVDTVNTGIFRVIRVSATTVWIENASSVPESQVRADIAFYSSTSLMPGDTITISTSLWDAANRGVWTVAFVGAGATAFGDRYAFRVDVSNQTPTVVAASPGALGSAEVKKVVVTEAAALRLHKRVITVVPVDASYADIKLSSDILGSQITAAAGSVLTVLDKLEFPTTLVKGVDGYEYTTGLLGEANRILYGDVRDRTTYPGVVAASSTVLVSGSLVKRLRITVAVRPRFGVQLSDIRDRVRSAVAAAVNKTPVGQSVAISDLVAAAGRVNGVVSVAVVSPVFDDAHDLISVQPHEKALVLNAEADVLVVFIGE